MLSAEWPATRRVVILAVRQHGRHRCTLPTPSWSWPTKPKFSCSISGRLDELPDMHCTPIWPDPAAPITLAPRSRPSAPAGRPAADGRPCPPKPQLPRIAQPERTRSPGRPGTQQARIDGIMPQSTFEKLNRLVGIPGNQCAPRPIVQRENRVRIKTERKVRRHRNYRPLFLVRLSIHS